METTMNNEIDLNKIKSLILAFTEAREINIDEVWEADFEKWNNDPTVEFQWQNDYKRNWQEGFLRDLRGLREAMRLFEAAIAQGDMVTACCAIVHAGVRSGSLASDFERMSNDFTTMLRTPGWSEIPEDYKIPEHYNYCP